MLKNHPWSAERSAIARSCRNAVGAVLWVLAVAAPGSALAAIDLPGMNLTAHCVQLYGSGATATLTQNNAYGWSCLHNGQYKGMNLNLACSTQHTDGYQAAYKDFNDPYSWYCVLRKSYTSMNSSNYTLYVWKGQYVALRTPDLTTCNVTQLSLVIDGLDKGYAFYQYATGKTPTLNASYPSRHYLGRDSITALPSGAVTGCAASSPACGYVGQTGIEIKFDTFQNYICPEAALGKHNQVGFYELGRNFWFYDGELKSTNANYGDAMVTGYAVLMRYLAMEYYGLPVTTAHDTQYANTKALVDTYRDANVLCGTAGATSTQISPGSAYCFKHDWTNTLLANQGISGLGTTDLFASFVLRLKRVHGWSFALVLWRQVEALGNVTTPYESADNFLLAASRAAGANLADLFQYKWRWPVSSSIRTQLQGELGTPVSTIPYN